MGESEPQPRNIIEIATPEGLTASINKTGAYLERLVAPDGTDLVFPRHVINSKRGGIPVCAPVFGPGDKAGLAQHGFARNLQWDEVRSGGRTALFTLQNPSLQNPELVPEQYSGCSLELNFALHTAGPANALIMRLKARNEGSAPFIFTPGFHPYFPTSETGLKSLKIQQAETTQEFRPDEIAEAKEMPEDSAGQLTFSTGIHRVTITTGQLPVSVVWSDNPARYVCVEPTYKGAATSAESEVKADLYVLEPGLTREHFMEIEWTPLS